MNLPGKLNEIVYQVIFNNPVANAYYKSKRKSYLTKEFLLSERYDELMLRHVADRKKFLEYINDAEDKPQNFRFRHFKANKILGSWRWKGLWKLKNELIPVFFDPEKKGIDFGGAFGPISMQAEIIDFSKKDIFDRPVRFHSLEEVTFKTDFIFSSHTLEHIENLDLIFQQFKGILKPEGIIVLNLPAYSCTRWQSGIHTHKDFNDHRWTFYLEGTKPDPNIKNLLAIDTFAAKYFRIEKKEYAGDNSIILFLKNYTS
ncbi:MAG: methyltransferase domain-containing protein [Bacteroidia bacterium]|nr:methyltransferase domain-containing protein [Bacteroidia bacterium]